MPLMMSPDGQEQMDVPDSLVAHYQSQGAQLVGASGSRLAQPAQTQALPPSRTGPSGLAGNVLNALPAAGGVIGGLGGGAVGGAFGMGLGLPEGAAIGAGLGTSGGEALRESLLRMGGYDVPTGLGTNARSILGPGLMAGGETLAAGKILQGAGAVAKSVGAHPAVQQAVKSLAGRLLRFGGVGEAAASAAEGAGEAVARTAPKAASEVKAATQAASRTVGNQGSSVEKMAAELAPAEEKTAAGQAAKRTVKPGAKGAKGKPLPGSAESRIKVVPRNAGQAGKSYPALARQEAARIKLVGSAPTGDDLAATMQKTMELESEMAHRGFNDVERAVARKAVRGEMLNAKEQEIARRLLNQEAAQ